MIAFDSAGIGFDDGQESDGDQESEPTREREREFSLESSLERGDLCPGESGLMSVRLAEFACRMALL